MTTAEAIIDIQQNIQPTVGGKSLEMAIEALQNNATLRAELERVTKERDAAVADLEKYQVPMMVIQEHWEPSVCPRCGKDFSNYEPCNDGYYRRAYGLDRCPYCGQNIEWHATSDQKAALAAQEVEIK